MKHYFQLALMATAVLAGSTACSSNDDADDVNKRTYEVRLNKPSNADNVVQYTLTQPMPAQTGAYSLSKIDITESGKALIELRSTDNQKACYVMEDVSISGNVYTMNGSKVKGTVEVKSGGPRLTRAGETGLAINVTVTLSREETVTYTTEDGTTVTTTATIPVSTTEAMSNLARTWSIMGAIIDVRSSDIKAYEEFDSKNGIFDLREVLDEAVEQGISLTEKEKADFAKQIKSVSITSTGLFTIDYADGGEDVAEWRWTNSEQTQFTIVLKNEDMGNKFIVSNTNIDVAYNDNRCNLKLQTTITDSNGKQWDVALTLKLRSDE